MALAARRLAAVARAPRSLLSAGARTAYIKPAVSVRSRAYSPGVPWQGCAYDPAPALDDRGQVPAAPYDLSPLAGTVPEYSTHIMVVPEAQARSDATWPSHIDAVCPLYSELSSRARPGGSLEGFGVGFASSDEELAPDAEPWDPHTPSAQRATPNQAAEDERFWIYAYRTPGLLARYPEPVSLRTLPSGEQLRRTLDELLQRREARDSDETHVFVCTHGMRDCRCGVAGTEVAGELRRQVQEHNAESQHRNHRPARRVRVLHTSHVGGHKWAANALVYPHGDWYGNLRVTDAPLLLRAALAPSSSRYDLHDLRERLVLWPRWRGRLGMSAEQQREHFGIWGPPTIPPAQITPRRRGAAAASPSPAASAATAAANATHDSTVQLRFRAYDGTWHIVPGYIGETVMQVARRHELPGIEATCGGDLECATCHAYLCEPRQGADPAERGDVEDEPKQLSFHVSEEEDDMLEYALFRKPTSRLTCQVRVSNELAEWMRRGGRVELPQYC